MATKWSDKFLAILCWIAVFLFVQAAATDHKTKDDKKGKPIITFVDWRYVEYRQHLTISCYTHSKGETLINISFWEQMEGGKFSLVKNDSISVNSLNTNYHLTFYIPVEESGPLRNFTACCVVTNRTGEVTKVTHLCTGPGPHQQFYYCGESPEAGWDLSKKLDFPTIVLWLFTFFVGGLCIYRFYVVYQYYNDDSYYVLT